MRALLVDDHPVVREGLRSMLTCDEVTVVAEAGTGADALHLAAETTPDVVLLDMQLPDMEGLAVLRALGASQSRAAVLVLSMHDDPALVRRALDAGAAGYMLKGVTRRDLLAAMRAACDGATVLDPALAPPARSPLVVDPLTAVERQVLGLMADGLTNRAIADRMRWSVASAKKYVQRVLEKLAATDRTQAVASALRLGLLR
jgi:DNA-binding NarL/FixJ family response regulator